MARNTDARARVQPVLEPGETLLWSGEPDRDVMLKTLGKRKGGFGCFGVVILVAIAAIVASQWDELSQLEAPVMTGLSLDGSLVFGVLLVVVIGAGILWLRRRQARGHVENLAYAITDRRLLIVRRGEVLESVTPARLQWVELSDRRGASRFSDIIWDRRPIQNAGSDSNPTPLQRERSRVGFKALADGPAVMERIERWRGRHRQAADEVTRAATRAYETGEARQRITHPRLGFGLACPEGWQAEVRKKKVVWGKTGVDFTANSWSDLAQGDDWNVLRLSNASSSAQPAEVLVEVARSEPVATFESMADPKLPAMLKQYVDVVDTEPETRLDDIPGFRVDQRLSGMGRTRMSVGETSDKVQTLHRQYVLHDGIYQYYLSAQWPLDDGDQAALCQAILASFRGCEALQA